MSGGKIIEGLNDAIAFAKGDESRAEVWRMTAALWQPIETAPKDHTPILSWDGEQCAVVSWCWCKKEWQLLEGHNEPHECASTWQGITHWMALPAPPTPN